MNARPQNSPFRSERGAILLVALVFGAVIAISLGSYVALNTQSLKMSNRSFYLAEAMNMAESGLEEAIWSFNQARMGDTSAWSDWDTTDTITAKRTFTDFLLGANATGSVKVFVDRYNVPSPSTYEPTVTVQATITLPGGQATITKMVQAKLRRRSYWAAGLVAKNGITFNGNTASVDSWVSNPDNNPATAAVPYAVGIRRDKGSLAAASITANITVGNADIYGTAAVAGSTATNITVGSNGRVGPFGTANGVKASTNVTSDFSTNLATVDAPINGTVLTTMPATIGTTGTTTVWRVPSIQDSLTVYGNVTLILTAGPGTSAIDLAGSGEGITLAAGATLTIYTAGDVSITGNGVLNDNAAPETFQLWGTSTSATPQNIAIKGNGALKSAIYAPNALITVNGNGDVMGAMVGKEINLTGNASFHYDESLAGWTGDTPFGVYQWREILSPNERATNGLLLLF